MAGYSPPRARETQGREENGDMDAVGHGHVAGLFGSGSSVPKLWLEKRFNRLSHSNLLQDLQMPPQRQLHLLVLPQGQLSFPLTLRIEDDVSGQETRMFLFTKGYKSGLVPGSTQATITWEGYIKT